MSPTPVIPTADRFWRHVVTGPGCWEWSGHRNARGYGRFNLAGKVRQAHRVSWALTSGPIPAGMHVCHHCDNPACVRPDHLFLGDDRANMEDASRKGRIAQAKLSVALVVVIRQEAAEGMTYAALARKYGVGEGPIARVVKRKSYAHVA